MRTSEQLWERYERGAAIRSEGLMNWLTPLRSWEGFRIEQVREGSVSELLDGELDLLCRHCAVDAVELRRLLNMVPVHVRPRRKELK